MLENKNLISFLVKRFLRFDKTQPFITVTAILAFLGVAIGTAVLMVAMGIMNGMSKEFEKKLFTMNYPITIYSKGGGKPDGALLDELKNNFPDLKFSPYLSSQVIVKKGEKLEGALLFGVDFVAEREINEILALSLKENPKDFEMVVGKGLRDTFLFDEQDKAIIIFTKNQPGGFSLIPIMKRFEVKGFFESGLHAYDKIYIYTTIDSLAKTLNYEDGVFDGIHVYSKEPLVDIEKIKKILPQYVGAVGWWQLNGNFFSAIELEKKALFIVLMLIILVASLNIISSLLMTVMNRRKEIALLISLGAHKNEIKKTFFYLGSLIGGSGIVFGIGLGFLSLFVLENFNIISLPADVYGTSKLPLDLSTQDFIKIVIGSILIVIFSSYYPAKKATQIDVLDTLRNE